MPARHGVGNRLQPSEDELGKALRAFRRDLLAKPGKRSWERAARRNGRPLADPLGVVREALRSRRFEGRLSLAVPTEEVTMYGPGATDENRGPVTERVVLTFAPGAVSLGDEIRLVPMHEPNLPLAFTADGSLSVKIDGTDILVRATIPKFKGGDTFLEAVTRGVAREMCIGFRCYSRRGGLVEKAEIFEISVAPITAMVSEVTWPPLVA